MIYAHSHSNVSIVAFFGRGEKPDFAWIPPEKIRHYDRARSQCLPSKKDKKYKSVMSALQVLHLLSMLRTCVLPVNSCCGPASSSELLRSTARMQIADRIHTDPRDLSADQADRILGANHRNRFDLSKTGASLD
eukprot:SAG31_NODE_280_length_18592_cov_33.584113_12_plen_134_part_00